MPSQAQLAAVEREYMRHSAAYRLQKAGVTIDGGVRVDFKRYPYLPLIVDNHGRRMTIVKGAQMGFTIAAILMSLELARQGGIRGIGYWFPTSSEAQVFSRSRFTPLMDQNPHVWNPADNDVDSIELKRIGHVAIYLRGVGQRGGAVAKSTSAIKSIPLDVNVFDEVDEMDPARVDAVHRRLDASPNPRELMLSTPTLPGWGVDYEYQLSDQSSWHWRCTACNGWTCLEDDFPDCIAEPRNKEPFYLCSKCRDPLVRDEGDWVARKPDVKDHVGLWISQLSSPSRTALDVVTEQERSIKNGRMREFYNQVLGRPYAEVEDQITAEQLNELVRNEPRPLRHEGPAAMGVDPGKPHWYEVRVRLTEKDSVQVARGRADSYEDLDRIAKQYNVESGVMDMGYDPSAVMRFCEDHPGWYGCLYIGRKKSDPDWDHKAKQVKAGRTRLLDDAHNEIIAKHVSYYQRDEFWHEQFVPQMTNLKRTTIENTTTGQREAQWVVTGGQKNDHLRHAGAYCWLAQQRVGLVKSMTRLHRRSRAQQRSGQKPRSAMVM